MLLQLVDATRRHDRRFEEIETRISDTRAEIELMLKAELLGRLTHFETQMDERLAQLSDRVSALERPRAVEVPCMSQVRFLESKGVANDGEELADVSWRPCRAGAASGHAPCFASAVPPGSRREAVHPVMTFDAPTGLSQRVHSSHPEEYPVSGVKPLSRGLLVAHGHRRAQDIRRQLDRSDRRGLPGSRTHSLAPASISVINLPVVFADDVIGAVNSLEARGYFTTERVAKIEGLAPFAAMALIVARSVPPPP